MERASKRSRQRKPESQAPAASKAVAPDEGAHPKSYATFWIAAATGLLLWTAFPPFNLWPLAWVAPAGWVWLARQPRLAGRRPYLQLYLAGCVHWLVMIQWVRLPHWSATFGWFALALYLAAYLPLFVGLCRIAWHRYQIPLPLAAPVIWCGLELLRGYFATGFGLALLGHSQVSWPMIIQVADLFGAYGVSFLMMLSAACLAVSVPTEHQRWRVYPVLVAAAAIAVACCYGLWQLHRTDTQDGSKTPLRVALIQGAVDTQFGGDDTAPNRDVRQTFRDYIRLTRQAVAPAGETSDSPQLIVWPESMFTDQTPWVQIVGQPVAPKDFPATLGSYEAYLRKWSGAAQRKAALTAQVAQRPMIVGSESVAFRGQSTERFNSALLFDAGGSLEARYDKMHPVMFGEYVPLGNVFPFLYRLTPMAEGLTPGHESVVFPVDSWNLCPSICFENTVPQLIRRQVNQLARAGTPPDALVTITNDGWFWGSSLLDVHLACGIFRAVETRRPCVIAANTGFSAAIDANGRVFQRGPRRQEAVVHATLHADTRRSLYLRWGDFPMGICVLLLVCLAVVRKKGGKT